MDKRNSRGEVVGKKMDNKEFRDIERWKDGQEEKVACSMEVQLSQHLNGVEQCYL